MSKYSNCWTTFDQITEFYLWPGKWTVMFTEAHSFSYETEGNPAVDSLLFDATEAFCMATWGLSYDESPMAVAERDGILDKSNWKLQQSVNEFQTEIGGQVYFVTVFEIDRAYGGPEEGGWWYDTGEPVLHIPCRSHSAAEDVRDRVREKYPHTGQSGSCVYQGGDYSITVDVRPGKAYPETVPHYE